MPDETYNGFTNRETWAVKLHIDNSFDWHHISQQMAYDARTEAQTGTFTNASVGKVYREPQHILADRIKDLITTYVDTFWQTYVDTFWPSVTEKHVPPTNPEVALLIQDVGSFDRVNWTEIANMLLEDEPELNGEVK